MMINIVSGSTSLPRVMAANYIQLESRSSRSYTYKSVECQDSKLSRKSNLLSATARNKHSKPLKKSVKCEAYSGERRVHNKYKYNFYELLGVDTNASQRDIKTAYRWLQKKCHPDVAGDVGHDMAILLNDAYATLSNSQLRAAYDEMIADAKGFEDYTGQSLYSIWLGHSSEERATFVDETNCIGCLKCALIAPNTFSIENRFGRARVVAQWGDSEVMIKDAIKACPVDCIWWVDRGKLPALEYIMSKQPRVVAGVDGESSGGERVADIFAAAEKFLKQHAEYTKTQEKLQKQETVAQREARMMATEALQARAGRWWHLIMGDRKLWGILQSSKEWNLNDQRAAQRAIIPLSWTKSTTQTDPRERGFSVSSRELAALFEAATQRRLGNAAVEDRSDEEYWVPLERISCPVSFEIPNNTTKGRESDKIKEERKEETHDWWADSLNADNELHVLLRWGISCVPLIAGMVAAVLVGFTSRPDAAFSEIEIVGPLPSDVSASTTLQVFLAAAVWYALGGAISQMLLFLTTLFIRSQKKK